MNQYLLGMGQSLAHRKCSVSVPGLSSAHLGLLPQTQAPALGGPQSAGDTVTVCREPCPRPGALTLHSTALPAGLGHSTSEV